MEHIFICAIGPVQDFIFTARRSRDLWYGSWMLSELSKAAAKKVAEVFPGSLVFPYPSDLSLLEEGSSMKVPNKIAAIVDGDEKSIRAFGYHVRDAVVDRLDRLGKDALGLVKGPINKPLAEEQIRDLPEYYWVSVPFKGEAEYHDARGKAEMLLAARKNTRDFQQAEGSDAQKSSLDGARESVIPETEYPNRRDPKEVKFKKVTNLYAHYHAHRGEQLSGVDLLKRLGEEKSAQKFVSTSHMAALPFLQRIGEDKKKQLLEDIRKLIEGEVRKLSGDRNWEMTSQDDGSLVFENRLSDWIPAEDISETLRQEFSTIMETHAGDLKPNPYYALLAADGDNMGFVIDDQKYPDDHRILSGAMSEFAMQVPKTVMAHQGFPIYSGGDDVLAYLPLHKVMVCAKKLETDFRSRLQKFQADKDGQKISPTLSIGIVIAHHLEPLSDVLRLAREAEKEAKKVEGKNGLAITVSKRGGVDRTISGKWGIFNERLERLIGFTQTGAISAGTAYELQELHRILFKAGVPGEGLAKEALRTVRRKFESGGREVVSREVKEAFKQWLEKDEIRLDELAKEMIVARMFMDDTILNVEKKEVSS
jgi:CRISPR-associated protein Cmr2